MCLGEDEDELLMNVALGCTICKGMVKELAGCHYTAYYTQCHSEQTNIVLSHSHTGARLCKPTISRSALLILCDKVDLFSMR